MGIRKAFAVLGLLLTLANLSACEQQPPPFVDPPAEISVTARSRKIPLPIPRGPYEPLGKSADDFKTWFEGHALPMSSDHAAPEGRDGIMVTAGRARDLEYTIIGPADAIETVKVSGSLQTGDRLQLNSFMSFIFGFDPNVTGDWLDSLIANAKQNDPPSYSEQATVDGYRVTAWVIDFPIWPLVSFTIAKSTGEALDGATEATPNEVEPALTESP